MGRRAVTGLSRVSPALPAASRRSWSARRERSRYPVAGNALPGRLADSVPRWRRLADRLGDAARRPAQVALRYLDRARCTAPPTDPRECPPPTLPRCNGGSRGARLNPARPVPNRIRTRACLSRTRTAGAERSPRLIRWSAGDGHRRAISAGARYEASRGGGGTSGLLVGADTRIQAAIDDTPQCQGLRCIAPGIAAARARQPPGVVAPWTRASARQQVGPGFRLRGAETSTPVHRYVLATSSTTNPRDRGVPCAPRSAAHVCRRLVYSGDSVIAELDPAGALMTSRLNARGSRVVCHPPAHAERVQGPLSAT